MKMHLENSAQHHISHYAKGVLSVNGVNYSDNILITRNQILPNWFSGDIQSLAPHHFEPLLSLDGEKRPEIVLLGTGEHHVFPDFSLIATLAQQGLCLEVMNTRAACRTYSVLLNEYRSVAAALIQL